MSWMCKHALKSQVSSYAQVVTTMVIQSAKILTRLQDQNSCQSLQCKCGMHCLSIKAPLLHAVLPLLRHGYSRGHLSACS